MGITNYTAFGPAKRNIDYSTLPCHPARQSADFVEGDVGRIAETALGWTTGNGMLYPEASKYLQMAVVHHDWNVEDDFTSGIPQDLHQTLIQV